MIRIKMHIFKAKLPFYPPSEVKCRLQNEVSTNYDESLTMCLLGILCSSHSSCSSCLLWMFFVFFVCSSSSKIVMEVLLGFKGLNPLIFTNLQPFEVFEHFWTWFQCALRSRKMTWMISLQMLLRFEGWNSWSSWRLWSLISAELRDFWMCVKSPYKTKKGLYL